MGWHELHLPTAARSKLKAVINQLPLRIENAKRLDGASPIAFEIGAEAKCTIHEEGPRKLDVMLTEAGVNELGKLLAEKSKESFRLPGLEDFRLVFSAR